MGICISPYVGLYSYGELNYCDRLHILITFIYIITPLPTSTHKPVLARAPSSLLLFSDVVLLSEYGNQLEDMRKTEAMKSFYKKVKSMRVLDQPYCPITTIKDAQGQIITDKHQIKQRWGGYFEGLLNPNEGTRDNNFSAQDILEHEPETQRSEVEESLKSGKTGKAPGIDGISIDIIKAAGEAV